MKALMSALRVLAAVVIVAVVFIFIWAKVQNSIGVEAEKNQSVTEFITDSNLREVSLDAVFGWQNASMNGNPNHALNQVAKLQSVLNTWPESRQNNQEPCYMQLRNETTRILNLMDGLDTPNKPDEPDYRYMCRQSIDYKYDEARVNAVWNKIH